MYFCKPLCLLLKNQADTSYYREYTVALLLVRLPRIIPLMAQGKDKQYYSLRAFASHLKTFKGWVLLVLGVFLISRAALAIIPIVIGKFVAALSTQPLDRAVVVRYMLILIGCSVVHDIFWRSAEILFYKKLNHRSYQFENTLFRAVVFNKYPYFVGKFTGKLSSYMGSLGKEYRNFVSEIFYNYSDYFVKFPILAYTMFTVNIYTGIMFLASLILLFIVGRVTIQRSLEAEKVATDVGSNMDGYMIDVISNFVSVKAFRKELTELRQIEQKRNEVLTAANNSYFWALVFWGSLGVIVRSFIWPATIIANTVLFINGQINLAQMTTFISAILIFSDYIWASIWNLAQFSLKLARMEEAYRYLFGKRNVILSDEQLRTKLAAQVNRKPLAFTTSLELKHLSFAYPDKKDRKVLHDMNLLVKKNEKIGIVGQSGGGKTTLIKLLLGYYKVSGEAILLDGKPVDNERLAELISYVPQDTSLFHRTLKENIAYTSTDASDEAIKSAARRAHAEEFIMHSPDGYETLVGERGIRLSMGQRQRIAIARAFLDDKEILVLDEATSALDSESEVLIQSALEDLWKGKTVLAIAHRLSTLRHMDRIMVIDSGKIVEIGSHKQLLKKKGHYYRLWQHQSGGMIADNE